MSSTLAPLGTVTGTTIKVLVGPGWAGDLNRDYINNQDDLNLVLSHFGQTVAPGDRSVGNTNDDTIINQADLNNVFLRSLGYKRISAWTSRRLHRRGIRGPFAGDWIQRTGAVRHLCY